MENREKKLYDYIRIKISDVETLSKHCNCCTLYTDSFCYLFSEIPKKENDLVLAKRVNRCLEYFNK